MLNNYSCLNYLCRKLPFVIDKKVKQMVQLGTIVTFSNVSSNKSRFKVPVISTRLTLFYKYDPKLTT